MTRPLSAAIASAAELYVGCVAGALVKEEYISIAQSAGLTNLAVAKEKTIHIPREVLLDVVGQSETDIFLSSGTAILSITLYGEKTRS